MHGGWVRGATSFTASGKGSWLSVWLCAGREGREGGEGSLARTALSGTVYVSHTGRKTTTREHWSSGKHSDRQ